MIRASRSNRTAWVFCAGTAAAVALLLKLEIGAACYAALALLIAARALRQRSWKFAAKDIACCLPGVAVCGIVLLLIISLRGAEFLTPGNIMSCPASFFIRTYGKYWLAPPRRMLTAPGFSAAAHRP